MLPLSMCFVSSHNVHLFFTVEVQREIERLFDLGTSMQLIMLDCDLINHPDQVAKSCFAPIVVYIKIASIRVLHRLIKNRGKNQKTMNIQTAASEKLLQCPQVRDKLFSFPSCCKSDNKKLMMHIQTIQFSNASPPLWVIVHTFPFFLSTSCGIHEHLKY